MDLTQQQLAIAQYSLLSEPGDQLAAILLEQLGADNAIADVISKRAHSKWPKIFLKLNLEEYLPSVSETIERFELRLSNFDIEEVLERSIRNQIYPLFDVPPSLQDLGFSKPVMLWTKGDFSLLQSESVSIVGTRAPSSRGLKLAAELTKRVPKDMAIVSGGAVGIDAAAHHQALSRSQPTIAFMAGGLMRLYPKQNFELFEEIVCRGLLVTELSCDVAPTRWRFLQRNRLIAALGIVTVVVEAAARSGTRNTVGHANALGRPVYAVPGDIENPASQGCNSLIADGLAQPISSLSEFEGLFEIGSSQQSELTDIQKRTLDAMGRYPNSKPKLLLESGLSNKELSLALNQLQQQRLVFKTPMGYLKES